MVALARSPLLDPTEEIAREIELITRSIETEVQRAWESGEFRPSGPPIASTRNRNLLPLPVEQPGVPIELDDEDPEIRSAAIDGLASSDAKEYLPRIIRMLKDESNIVQRAARNAVRVLQRGISTIEEPGGDSKGN